MTDRDTIVRVGELFRRAVIATRPRQTHHKVAYVTTIKGMPAARMMRALAPLMSPRRRSQIERALRGRHPRAGRPTRRSSHASEELITDGADLSWETTDANARTAWLAGLLEGEGSFVAARFDSHSYPRVQVSMCDRFVLERAMTIMPGSHIYAVSDKRNVERGWSETWIVMVNGFPAADVMRAVRPWMGSRRTMQIDRSLSAWHPIRVAPRRFSCIVPGCWRRHAARGLCNTHYMSWSRDRARGRVPRITPLR
jgi:hypothetical protein